ncbi:MAG: hypothetical protein KDB09_02010 [Acidimicrobiales bacterium]|nr:hypothetical protein [Acidimicrobiales bacterium]
MASDGAATVLVAHTDQDSVELVARVAEGAGHRAVRSTDPTPPSVVETAVHELALVVVLDTRSTSLEEVTAVAEAFDARGYPAGTLLLTDGRVAAEHALHSGANRVLVRPFHQRDLVDALDAVLHPDRAEPPSVPESESDMPRPLPMGSGHAFTDILRMGRQL